MPLGTFPTRSSVFSERLMAGATPMPHTAGRAEGGLQGTRTPVESSVPVSTWCVSPNSTQR
jgi:hypothetical protein